MANVYGIYDITGSMMTTHSSSLGSDSFLSGNINHKNQTLRRKIRRLLTDDATRNEVGEAPDLAGGVSNVTSYLQQKATMPSWTQKHIGFNHAYVIPTLSSSMHEASRLNAYASASKPLETTAVPASSTVYYEKGRRLRRIYYTLSASAGMTPSPANETSPSTIERLGRGTWEPFSGSYRNNTYHNPATFQIDVPDRGRIRDVRVWVEFIHDIRGGAGTLQSSVFNKGGAGSATAHREHGLQGVQIALRSPNTSFRSAHPLWNDPRLKGIGKDGTIPGLLQNSYLLWAGHACEKDLSGTLGSLTSSFVDADDNRTMEILVTSGSFSAPSAYLHGMRDKTTVARSLPSNTGPNSSVFGGPTFTVVSRGSSGGMSNTRLHLLTLITGSTRFFGWSEVDTLDVNENAMSVGFRFDSKGYKHLLYQSASFGASTTDLVYARMTGSSWEKEVVTTFTSEKITSYDLALDESELPNIVFNTVSYAGVGSCVVYFARKNADGTWTREDVSAHDSGKYVKIDYDVSRSQPVIAASTFGSGITQALNIYKSGSNGWSSEVALTSSTSTALQHPGLAIDSSGKIHAAALAVASGRGTRVVPLYYASSSGGWYEAGPLITSSLSDTHEGLSFVLDKRENPCFSWTSYTSNTDNKAGCRIALSDENGWTIKTMFTGSGFQETGMGFDDDNNAIVLAGAYDTLGAVGWSFLSFENRRHSSSLYNEFDTDIDMRTIFTDSSPINNPRNLSSLHGESSLSSTGFGKSTRRLLLDNKYPSPSSASISRGYNAIGERLQMTEPSVLSGANYPWMCDQRVFPGRLTSFATPPSGAVPPEWYSGLSGQFSSSGEQLGPSTIQPVYPLLDDVYVEKIVDFPTTSQLPFNRGSAKLIGFRPGLRDTEVNGKWTLLIGTEGDSGNANARAGIWFRQFRLEFLIDEGPRDQQFYPSRSRKFSKPSHVPAANGKRLIAVMSGSSIWDIGTNIVYTEVPQDYGRTVGITDSTGSSLDGFAVFSRVTGTLYDRLDSGAKSAYLSNEFGTPYIPLSSGSGEDPSFDPFTKEDKALSRQVLNDIIGAKANFMSSNTLKSFASRSKYSRKVRDIVSSRFSGSL